MVDDYKTDRIIVMACSIDLAKSLILYRDELVKRSPIVMPNSWPSNLFKGFLPYYIEQLESGEEGFKFWIIADLKLKKMVGDFIFHQEKGRKGYMAISFISPDAELEYLEESLYIFMKYTVKSFPKEIKSLAVDCLRKDAYKLSVLKDLGFIMDHDDSRYSKWTFTYH
ncbi:hypothetical protein JOC77_001829 [Peribacillus deserti]|uniref:GNAT family N-acetyltransferase n=1 Tax=Peribacillus deserti TaxID=673318 RepID=A0ABS2QHW1_9BACI|nr:hypothetical protein [Peribacillus deserti]MBM7692399.1 hypothetical protein [Peribacillus deserti]